MKTLNQAERTVLSLITLLVACNGGRFVYKDWQLEEVESWPLELKVEKDMVGNIILTLGRK